MENYHLGHPLYLTGSDIYQGIMQQSFTVIVLVYTCFLSIVGPQTLRGDGGTELHSDVPLFGDAQSIRRYGKCVHGLR